MENSRFWRGVRMRRVAAGADPDAAPRRVTLPAAWDDDAAAALAGLAPGAGAVAFADAAEAWIAPIAARAAAAGLDAPLGDPLRILLLQRRAAPAAPMWRGDAAAPRIVLNLAAFHEPGLGFDAAGLADAAETVCLALGFATRRGDLPALGLGDLAGLIAACGLAYDAAPARDLARAVAGLVLARLDAVALRLPALPRAAVAIAPAGAAEALLGVETAGIAPAFSPLAATGGLSRASHAFLAAHAMAPEAALAALLGGQTPLPQGTAAGHAAMHDALAPLLRHLPPRPAFDAPAIAAPGRRELPARRAGYTQRATVGGHTLFLRTGDYADGALGEITVASPKESPAFRGLMDSFASAVSVGLQHGVPLDAFVEALTGTRFGPAGAVEGDPEVARASSLVDYVFRHLAGSYLGRALPEAAAEAAADAPLLPLGLPEGSPRRRALRLVAR